MRRLQARKNPSLCTARGKVPILHAHPFAPSGCLIRFGCYQIGLYTNDPPCKTDGYHEPCATCGWPADEHPQGEAR